MDEAVRVVSDWLTDPSFLLARVLASSVAAVAAETPFLSGEGEVGDSGASSDSGGKGVAARGGGEDGVICTATALFVGRGRW